MHIRSVLAGLCLIAFGAQAHTPYLVPASFEPVYQDQITLDASFTEKFFVPDVVFNDSEFFVVGPDGDKTTPDTRFDLKTRVVVEHQLPESGTYRFSTGVRYGAVFRIYEVDGERRGTRDPEEKLPEGAVLLQHFQSVTQAESYVSKDGPTSGALQPSGVGLEILPLSHPNELFAGETFNFRVLFNGEPLPDFEVVFQLGKDQFDQSEKQTITTDDKGEGGFVPSEQGVYLMMARHRTPAPKDAPAPQYSHTTTLSIEAY